MRILWAMPRMPLPCDDGAKVATKKLLTNLSRLGARVDVISIYNEFESFDREQFKTDWKVDNFYYIKRNIPTTMFKKGLCYFKNLLFSPLTPFTISSFNNKKIKNKILQYANAKSYDYLLLDGLHLFSILPKKLPSNMKVILRAHNVEHLLWKDAFKKQKKMLLKMSLIWQYILVKRFEKSALKKVDVILPISSEDKQVFEKITTTNLQVANLGMSFKNELQQPMSNSINLLFIGRLDWAPNKDGLKWFLNEVWPEVLKKRDDLMLTIIGSGCDKWCKDLNIKNITFLGRVKEILPHYQNCDYTIAPIFYGSGTRIKVIESYAYSRAIIATEKAIQGSSLNKDEYFLAQTKMEWIEKLIKLKKNMVSEEKMTKIRTKLSLNYDEEKIGQMIFHTLKTSL